MIITESNTAVNFLMYFWCSSYTYNDFIRMWRVMLPKCSWKLGILWMIMYLVLLALMKFLMSIRLKMERLCYSRRYAYITVLVFWNRDNLKQNWFLFFKIRVHKSNWFLILCSLMKEEPSTTEKLLLKMYKTLFSYTRYLWLLNLIRIRRRRFSAETSRATY